MLAPEKHQITYHTTPEKKTFFFTPELIRTITGLSDAIGSNKSIHVFPDATKKSNLLPNGIAIHALRQNTLLIPRILRDPGCGFLVFKLEPKNEPFLHHQLGKEICDILDDKKVLFTFIKEYLKNISLEDIIYKGLNALPLSKEQLSLFNHHSFTVNEELVKLTNEEKKLIYDDLLNLSNTIEIKNILNLDEKIASQYSLRASDKISFIHSGSVSFPKILNARFDELIKYTCKNTKNFSPEQIDKGFYGIPINSPIGLEYSHWIKAAMNFSLANRFILYHLLKRIIEEKHAIKVSILSDTVHAGAFIDDTEVTLTRGVQKFNHSKNIALIAGHRETISTLVEFNFSTNDKSFMLPHGTGCCIFDDMDYTKKFKNEEINDLLELAKNTFYNTNPNFHECIPFTLNHIEQLNCMMLNEQCKIIATLAPLINIHGNYLIQLNERN